MYTGQLYTGSDPKILTSSERMESDLTTPSERKRNVVLAKAASLRFDACSEIQRLDTSRHCKNASCKHNETACKCSSPKLVTSSIRATEVLARVSSRRAGRSGLLHMVRRQTTATKVDLAAIATERVVAVTRC